MKLHDKVVYIDQNDGVFERGELYIVVGEPTQDSYSNVYMVRRFPPINTFMEEIKMVMPTRIKNFISLAKWREMQINELIK